jgi:uncharacterized membrane protein affecting hemolysin expression
MNASCNLSPVSTTHVIVEPVATDPVIIEPVATSADTVVAIVNEQANNHSDAMMYECFIIYNVNK